MSLDALVYAEMKNNLTGKNNHERIIKETNEEFNFDLYEDILDPANFGEIGRAHV